MREGSAVGVQFEIHTADRDQVPHIVTCGCPGAVPFHFPTWAAAAEWCARRGQSGAGTVPVGCTDELCSAYSLYPTIADHELGTTVGFSSANARRVLGCLGYAVGPAGDLMGEATPQELMGRVLVASALTPADEGVPAVVHGNWVVCGRRPGYLQDAMTHLYELAETAERYRGLVVWA